MEGKSVREVAAAARISIGSTVNIRKQCHDNIPPSKSGAHRKVQPKTLELVARQFNEGEIKTLRQSQRLIQKTSGVAVAKETIRRNLRLSGVKAHVLQKQPYLMPHHIRTRYEFAKEHKDWTVHDWSKVMFSDESVISRVGSFGRQYYYSNEEHKRKKPHQIRRTPQAGGGKMMVWDCITYQRQGDLRRIEERLNSELYVDILNDYVLASFDFGGMDPANSIFQQDNSRVHTAKLVQRWFDEQEFTVLKWPANSPDLTIIENVWSYLKYHLNLFQEDPKDMEELWKRVEDIWSNIPEDYLHKLYESMPRRIEALLKSKGGPTNY